MKTAFNIKCKKKTMKSHFHYFAEIYVSANLGKGVFRHPVTTQRNCKQNLLPILKYTYLRNYT